MLSGHSISETIFQLRRSHDADVQHENSIVDSLIDMQVDRSLLQEREQNRQAEVEKHRAALKALRDELEAERLKAEAADASRKSADEELEDANEEIERLRKHVVDLESRKRPPLYQRKQEEELQVRFSTPLELLGLRSLFI